MGQSLRTWTQAVLPFFLFPPLIRFVFEEVNRTPGLAVIPTRPRIGSHVRDQRAPQVLAEKQVVLVQPLCERSQLLLQRMRQQRMRLPRMPTVALVDMILGRLASQLALCCVV